MKVPRLRLWLATGLVAVTGAAGALTAPAAHAATGCRVDYSVTNQWPGGFGANVSITNLGELRAQRHGLHRWRQRFAQPAREPLPESFGQPGDVEQAL